MFRSFQLQFFAEDAGDDDQKKEQPGKSFSQADVDCIVADRLKREKEKYADYEDLKGKAEKLKDIEAAQMTEQKKAQAKIAELEVRNAETEAKVRAMEISRLRSKLLTDEGLPADLADRVRGETEEEIKADLEFLKAIVKPKNIGGGGVPQASKDQKNP